MSSNSPREIKQRASAIETLPARPNLIDLSVPGLEDQLLQVMNMGLQPASRSNESTPFVIGVFVIPYERELLQCRAEVKRPVQAHARGIDVAQLDLLQPGLLEGVMGEGVVEQSNTELYR